MRRSNWEFSKKSFLKTVLSAVLLAVGFSAYFFRIYGEMRVADACFLAGLFFCCIGLFRIVRILGLFDLPTYGYKKVWDILQTKLDEEREPKIGDYADYRQNQVYEPCFTEPLAVGAVMVLIATLAM